MMPAGWQEGFKGFLLMRTESKLPASVEAKNTYDPVKKAEEIAKVVCRDDQRKYYRFRPARFYGGIATSDCVGCCLQCIFCWSWREVIKPASHGNFYSPQQVARKLTNIARKKRFNLLRISGNEPTIGRGHLLQVLELIPKTFQFILETNGILIGHDKTYADDLARFENLYVRVSLKGTNEEEFSLLTGAEPAGFTLQIRALENLSRAGVDVHPAVMVSFSPPENLGELQKRLKVIDASFEDVEIEELALYGDVEERLRRAGFEFRTAHYPRHIPPEQV
jgi:uncharacterized Fe-S cluster-containing radical SAM superfamily protein